MLEPLDLDGAPMPRLGFGTFRLRPKDAYTMVGRALAIGYRHIDTAAFYGNETEVGRAIADSPVPRDEVFLTTKVWPEAFPAELFEAAVEQSLKKLGTEPDLLLLHWPNRDVDLDETIGRLCAAKRKGQARRIGVSNFNVALLDQATAAADERLVTNQIEYHPYLSQRTVKDALDRHGSTLTAYSPLAQGKLLNDPTLSEIGRAHRKSAGQVALAWLVAQPGVSALPRTRSPAHAEANFAIHDFTLSETQMKTISDLARPDGRVVNPPSWAPAWD